MRPSSNTAGCCGQERACLLSNLSADGNLARIEVVLNGADLFYGLPLCCQVIGAGAGAVGPVPYEEFPAAPGHLAVWRAADVERAHAAAADSDLHWMRTVIL